MKTSSFSQELINDVLEFLDPFSNYKRKIKFSQGFLEIQGKEFSLKNKLHLFAVGKAASFELEALLRLFNDHDLAVEQAVSYTKEGHTLGIPGGIELEGTHPLVSLKNLESTENFIQALSNIEKEDSLIFLLSGGTSALLEMPKEGMSFEEFQNKQRKILNSGKSISNMNKERKALSIVKNGGLLNFIPTNRIAQFITCDVPSEILSDVGSGPLLKENGQGAESFMMQSASALLNDLCLSSGRINAGVFDVGIGELMETLEKQLPEKGTIHFSGGEAPIQVSGAAGKGGRNTHFVLAFAHRIYRDQANRDIQLLSFGTDGSDGDTDAAGAWLNYDLYKSLDPEPYLKGFNSYEYFLKVGSLLKTGPTKANVMDLRCMWREGIKNIE